MAVREGVYLNNNMRDLIIVGAGPAGLSAAVYAKRAALDALVFEKNHFAGGQIMNTYEVDNYLGIFGIGGFELAMRFREHADRLECAIIEAETSEIKRNDEGYFLVNTSHGEHQARTVLIATGASHAHLGVPGERELAGMGVSYCATCDGAFFRNKRVAVVGGGDVAVEDALFLARASERVYLIHRRGELRAAPILAKALLALPNVEVLWDTVVESINGNGQVEGLEIKNVKSGEASVLPVTGVFIAVGLSPNSQAFRASVPCDENGYIIAGEDGVTQTPGIFAAGDIRTKKLRQIVTAVADGAVAVNSIRNYLLLQKC
jgi:thioredoxin reductase (NADPH)